MACSVADRLLTGRLRCSNLRSHGTNSRRGADQWHETARLVGSARFLRFTLGQGALTQLNKADTGLPARTPRSRPQRFNVFLSHFNTEAHWVEDLATRLEDEGGFH